MSFLDEMPTSSGYSKATFQEMVIGEIGELLPAELIDACELENARAVLEIGCGAGEWLRSIARKYPQLQCIGADQDKGMVMIANAQAERDGLPITNSPAFERLIGLLCEALDKAGRIFIPESMMDPSLLQEQGTRKRKLGKIYKRHHLGITPMLGLWLHEAGCGRINPSSESARRIFRGYAAIPPDPYAIRLSNGSMAYKSFMQVLPQLLRRARLFLWGKGVIGLEEFDDLCEKLEKELTNDDFYGLAFVARVWGRCW